MPSSCTVTETREPENSWISSSLLPFFREHMSLSICLQRSLRGIHLVLGAVMDSDMHKFATGRQRKLELGSFIRLS